MRDESTSKCVCCIVLNHKVDDLMVGVFKQIRLTSLERQKRIKTEG